MRLLLFVVLAAWSAVLAAPAGANEVVIRGAAISFPNSDQQAAVADVAIANSAGTAILRGMADREVGAAAYSGSSMPPAVGGTTILRGGRPAEIVRRAPASNLGGDTDGPVLNPACLYTEPPTCR